MKPIYTILILCALVFSIGFVYLQNTNEGKPARVQQKSSTKIAGASIGGPYELVDQDGNVRSDTDFAGKYKLIYFGFTYCPAICPTELAKITATLKTLPQAVADRIQPLFITIDPERDTPEVMKSYISLFDPRFIGLTGSVEQINHVKSAYRIYAQKVQSEDLSDYTMDHSSYVYLMSPDDELISIYRGKDTVAKLKADIESHVH